MKPYVTGLAGWMFLFSLARGLGAQEPSAPAAPASAAARAAPALNVPSDHPRIFFTKHDLAGFKERMNGKPLAAGARGRTAVRGHGFNFAVLGDKESAERAIQAALQMCTPGL